MNAESQAAGRIQHAGVRGNRLQHDRQLFKKPRKRRRLLRFDASSTLVHDQGVA
jgi:hypothetical protein